MSGNRVLTQAVGSKCLVFTRSYMRISARKRAEETLREAHDHLAYKVIERAVEMTELSHRAHRGNQNHW